MSEEATMSTQGKMEERLTIRETITSIAFPWVVERDFQVIAFFKHESDARRFVAGEKAIEALKEVHEWILSATTTDPETFVKSSIEMIEQTVRSALSQLPSDDKAGTP